VLRRVVRSFAILTVGFVALLAIEALLALNWGRRLPERGPLVLDRAFEVDGDSVRALRLAWLGDSTGAGIGSSGAEAALVTLVAGELDRSLELRVLAKPGARIGDVLTRQLARLEAIDPDVVVLAVGGNDVTHLTSEGLFETQYDQVLRALAGRPALKVVSVGIGDFSTVPRIPQPLRAVVEWRARALDDVLRKVTASHDVPYVDLFGETGPVFADDPERYYAPDGFHPNDAGYRVWADAILEVLRPLVPP
jgi:lysophospholipase L1-like esterase